MEYPIEVGTHLLLIGNLQFYGRTTVTVLAATLLYETAYSMTVLAKHAARCLQDPKTKSKQLALLVFKLQKQLFHPGKIFTVLAKLSATSNFQQFSQLYDPKTLKDPQDISHIQLNVNANYHSSIMQETR